MPRAFVMPYRSQREESQSTKRFDRSYERRIIGRVDLFSHSGSGRAEFGIKDCLVCLWSVRKVSIEDSSISFLSGLPHNNEQHKYPSRAAEKLHLSAPWMPHPPTPFVDQLSYRYLSLKPTPLVIHDHSLVR